jgi:hypothetical protein
MELSLRRERQRQPVRHERVEAVLPCSDSQVLQCAVVQERSQKAPSR